MIFFFLHQAHEELEVYAGDYKSVRADMTRQYKTMQVSSAIESLKIQVQTQ